MVKERDRVKEEEGGNVTCVGGGRDESTTFTAALLSTSVGVKSRRRKNSNDYKDKKPKHKPETAED